MTEPLHRRLGLKDDKHERIVTTLGREPRSAELAMYGAMWSEHCSYKSSKIHLKSLPTEGPSVLVGPGQDAGAVDVGEGWAAVFKMESHSHPSAIEPYQGAATGVGLTTGSAAAGAAPTGAAPAGTTFRTALEPAMSSSDVQVIVHAPSVGNVSVAT